MRKNIYLLMFTLLFLSCEKAMIEKDPTINPVENFESLWTTIDNKYSFFEYKNINWDELYQVYQPQINDNMYDEQLFDVLAAMITELRDGHTNLVSPFNLSRYTFQYSSPENFNFRLLKDNYIGWDYYITGPLINTFIIRDEKLIGYIYYGSFSSNVNSWHIDYVLSRFRTTDGIILDMRSNGGGSVSNIYTLGSRFADSKRLIYTSALKNGPNHNDFDEAAEVYLNPGGNTQYTKPVVLLTNRGCFSATSFFSTAMKAFPHVIQVGDTTGGGLGAPSGFELPNGWSYRFSVSQTLTPDGKNYEDGVPPDITVWMDPEHEANGIDDIMERAIDEILEN